MNGELLAAVQESGAWLDRFTRREYSAAFREYVERFGPPYMEAVRGGAELPALAAELLDGLEEGWRRQRLWNRASVRAREKLMLVAYLSPMLLGLEEPACRTLAELLRDGWAARRPKDPYRLAEYRTLRRGFRNTILGLDLGRLAGPEEEEP